LPIDAETVVAYMSMSIRTTIYLPEQLKEAVEREAARRGISEAQLIREAVAKEVARPRPNAGFLDAEPMAERAEELLAGFGER
jgi:predicted transcriptional regulator